MYWNIPGLQYLRTLSVPAPVRWLPGLHLRADVLPREYQHDGGLKLMYIYYLFCRLFSIY